LHDLLRAFTNAAGCVIELDMCLMLTGTADLARVAVTCHELSVDDVASGLPNPQVKSEDEKKSVLSRSTSFRDVTGSERHLVEKRRSECLQMTTDLSEEDDKLQRILKQKQKQQEFQEKLKKQLQNQMVSKETVGTESPSTGHHLNREFNVFILCLLRTPRCYFFI